MEESYERSDIESSLRSYRSRAVDFKEVLESGELGRQRNVGDETRTKIIQQEFSGSGMIASITRVCYGTFNKRKAGIIVFQFLFHWSSDGYQVRCLDVEITFEPRSKRARRAGVDNTLLPVVLNLSPRKAYGIPNSGGRKWLYSVEQQTNDRPSSTVKSATCNVGQKAFEEAHRLEIVGTPWSDSRRREPHKACWTIKEIGRQIFGLPDEINVAVLVECEDDFQADVRLTLDLPLYRRLLRGFPWPADDPILFTPKWNETLIGKPLRTTQFETLSDADWDLLISGYEDSGSIATSRTGSEITKSTREGHKTYRVQGIPAEYGPDTVGGLLKRLLQLDNDFDIEIGSLTSGLEQQDEQVATVSSSRLEAILGLSDQLCKILPPDTDKKLSPRKTYVSLDTNFHDFTPLAVPRGDYLFDIIALSGLGAHAFGSFKERKGNHMWLRDAVPFDFPGARVLIYGYDTRLADSQSFQDLESIASTFRTALKIARPNSPDGKPNEKPIVFIAHSLGGIVLKQALIQMADGDDRDRVNSQATRGILFFGVPSQGMDISSLLGMVEGQVNEQFLQNLQHDSSALRNQHRELCAKFPYKTCKIISFYETELSPTAKKGPNGWQMNGEPAVLVGQSSATLGSRPWEVGVNYMQAIKRNHSEMVKFYPRDPCYSIVRYFLDDLVRGIGPDASVANNVR